MKTAIVILLFVAEGAFCLGSFPPSFHASTPAEYMLEVYQQMTGTAADPSKPTDVWCFPDRDVFKQAFRQSPPSIPPCSAPTRYVFQWPELAEALSLKPLDLSSMYLRAYLHLDQDHFEIGETQTIEFAINVTLLNSKTRPTNIPPGSPSTSQEIGSYSTTQEIVVDGSSGQWIELELTNAASELWSAVKDSNEIQVTVAARVECGNLLGLVNPAEIPLENENERKRLVATLQPLLLVFARDISISHNPRPTANQHSNTAFHRGKRTMIDQVQESERCQKHNYTIFFSDLIDDLAIDFIYPYQLNIGQCSGSCEHHFLWEYPDLGSNHAKIMSLIQRKQARDQELDEASTPSDPAYLPCCVPTSFGITELLFRTGGGSLIIHCFNDLEIESCGCR